MANDTDIQEAAVALDAHVAEIINWHFSPETGCSFWLDWANEQDWNPLEEVQSFDDLCQKISQFSRRMVRMTYLIKCGFPKHIKTAPLIFLKQVELLACLSNA